MKESEGRKRERRRSEEERWKNNSTQTLRFTTVCLLYTIGAEVIKGILL